MIIANDSDRLESYSPKVVRFKNFSKDRRLPYKYSVESFTCISLPFHIKKHIVEKFSLGRSDRSARVVYVEIRDGDKDCSIVHNEKPF